jgi:hypothetical protein
MEKDVEVVYNFCNELLTTRRVSDATELKPLKP